MTTVLPQVYEVMADPARSAGVAVGRILAVAVLIALVVLAFVLIGRRRRRKRNQQHNANPYGPQR
jgi:uncharacterized membrane protein